MTESNAYSTDFMDIPENSRLARYCKEFYMLLEEDASSLDPFLRKIFEDCKDFLVKNACMTDYITTKESSNHFSSQELELISKKILKQLHA